MLTVVTGGNRGIGYEITRRLARSGARVILACRNPSAADAAIDKLAAIDGIERSQFESAALDVSDSGSVDAFLAWLGTTHPEGVDAFVNNAGVGFRDEAPNLAHSELTLNVNYRGLVRLTQGVVPLLKADGPRRIVTVSSQLGCAYGMKAELKAAFLSCATVEELNARVDEYVAALGTYAADPSTEAVADYGSYSGILSLDYTISKLAVNSFTQIMHTSHPDLMIAATHPGWCRTNTGGDKSCDLGGSMAPLSPEEGSDTTAWLALEATRPVHGGKFFTVGRSELPM